MNRGSGPAFLFVEGLLSTNCDKNTPASWPGGAQGPAYTNAGTGISNDEKDGFGLPTDCEPRTLHSHQLSALQYDPRLPPFKGAKEAHHSELRNVFDSQPPKETAAFQEAPSSMDESSLGDADEPVEIAIIDESGEDCEHEPTTSRPSAGKRHPRSSRYRLKGKSKHSKNQLGKLRSRTLQTRVKAHEMRNALRTERSETTDADVRFMTALQSFMSQTQSKLPDRLLQLFDDCQTTRDRYLPLEDDYNAFENKLDRQEYELDNAERRFYTKSDVEAVASYSEPEGSMVFEDSDSLAPSAYSAGVFSDYPARLMDYYSRIGDLDIAHERLEDLRGHRAALVEEHTSREVFNLSLDLEAQAFLENFDESHTQMQAKVAHIEADVSRLKSLCQEEGLLDLEGEIAKPGDDPDLRLELLQAYRHPLLALDSNEEFRFSNVSPSSNGRLNRSDFINKWLLQGLRGSLREIRLLTSMPQLQHMNINPENLKDLVITWWPKDGAATDMSSFARIGTQTMSLMYESEGDFGQRLSLDDYRHRIPDEEALVRASSV